MLLTATAFGDQFPDPLLRQIECGPLNVYLIPLSGVAPEVPGLVFPGDAHQWGVMVSIATSDSNVAAYHIHMNLDMEDGVTRVIDAVVEKRPDGERTYGSWWLGGVKPIRYRKVIITRLYAQASDVLPLE